MEPEPLPASPSILPERESLVSLPRTWRAETNPQWRDMDVRRQAYRIDCLISCRCSDVAGKTQYLSFFTAPMADPSVVPSSAPPRAQTEPTILREQASEWVSDTVVLCPCSKGEWLPMNTDYPVDIFTSSLTTPLKIVLQWSIQRNPVSMASLHPDAETTFLVFSTIEKLHLEN
ncbi:predicted protein [Phaeodactylum tricornutum CCAP 1055/1]|uniref:Uncharacterized protein n=2 Tax=Phaeodactylum tricornutum TaxID=2850 RepID=B7FYR3_PHATC|nr:predicted protein [Phaeodactylum tricornutum CCAP 1055/1]EEC48211.1 predicted protein [Phaeodactylum tricornutum CCAP 1055/1]|eukprot:XP_002180020.1 predicted protein [Phaeodactylum tricornutum CCAP 1055/1]